MVNTNLNKVKTTRNERYNTIYILRIFHFQQQIDPLLSYGNIIFLDFLAENFKCEYKLYIFFSFYLSIKTTIQSNLYTFDEPRSYL